ncbi:hypothetical protein BDN70DRAFT_885408 [Pholiota conissans]|uniref:Uncharacterized protein n=1 Tax=Pholiota conissans TaxID=109636 RepID=A0A9P5YSN6_9AGAR|nr:hypothetical protein BDN70DRAFT_885408 [Pholiota conissans]
MTSAVVVDDTDSHIQYVGNWLPISNYGDIGNLGKPMQNTLHNALSSNARLSYNFTGYGVEIYGIDQRSTTSTSPSFSCFVDHQLYPVVVLPSSSIALCKVAGLSNDSHILEAVVPLPLQRPFLFDFIKYFPSIEVTLEDHAIVLIEFADQQVLGDAYRGDMGSWEEVTINGSPIARATRDPNNTFELDFNGTSLTWFGLYDEQYPSAPTMGAYSVDGQEPVSFPLKGVSSGILLNQTIFQISSLSPTVHKLMVTYGGDNSTTPLSLSSLMINNGTMDPSPTTASNTSPTNPIISTTPDNKSLSRAAAHRIGLIVGGSLAAVFFTVCIVVIFIFLRRRHTKSPKGNSIEPFSRPPPTVFFLSTWLHRRKELELEAVETPAQETDVQIIPPRKLSEALAVTTTQRIPRQFPTDIEDVSRAVDVQEQDSGVRLEPDPSSRTVTRLLPPAYTEF